MSGNKSSPKLSVILAMTPRCGSYLLCDLLHATGHVPLADELLTEVGLDQRRMAYGIPTTTSWQEVLEQIPSSEMNADGIFAIKLVWDQFHGRLSALGNCSMQELEKTAEKTFPNPKYIWIRRRDLVGQSVSWAKALQNRQWRNLPVAQQEPAPAELLFSAHDIFWCSYFIQEYEDSWSQYFAENDIRPCTVYYEDLIADPQTVIGRICEYLELPGPGVVNLPGKPQRDEVNLVWKNRYNYLLAKMTDEEGDPKPLEGSFPGLAESITMQTGSVQFLEVRIRNDSNDTWFPRLSRTGMRGAIVRIDGLEGDPFIGELQEALEAADETTIPIRIAAPMQPGEYTLRCRLVDCAIGPVDGDVLHGTISLKVDHSPNGKKSRNYLGDYKILHTGWCELPWLGFFFDDWFPFIYHKDHGFWWIDADSPLENELRIHDVHIGWIRYSIDQPGTFLRESDDHRIRLLSSDGELRYFEDIDTGEQFKLPACLKKYFSGNMA